MKAMHAATLCVLAAVLLGAQSSGWTIPDEAAAETSPIAITPHTLDRGRSLYLSNCAGCHGTTGLGDGPNVDRKDRKNRPANLTLSRNPGGVVFYKIWNGRHDPDMPAFKSRMTADEVWAIVAYVTQSLRASP